VNHQRPKNLDLFTIRFPLPAIISILHRISGFVLVVFIPIVLWLLSMSLTYDGFNSLQQWSDSFFIKLCFWAILAPFCVHLVAGVRHLLMDAHIGTTLKNGKRGAKITLIVSIVLILLAGIWLW
jgi:succinate dehydrogenase / fumarate reductase cytochrome b subunit